MSFADAMVGIAKAVNAMNGRGRIERLCRELGWPVDERDNERIKLYFKDPVTGRRPVFIRNGDGPLVRFSAQSVTEIPCAEFPEQILGHLLLQNTGRCIAKWQFMNVDGVAALGVCYVALGDGLTPAALKAICEELIDEVSDFDGRMKKAGLL